MTRFAAAAIVWLAAVPAGHAVPAVSTAARVAPNFSLKDLNGKVRHLTNYRGKLVIVNFWATWCPPCLIEIPSMERTYEKFKDRGFVILGVEVGEGWSIVQPFAAQMKITYPILLDQNAAVSRKWGMVGLPTSYVIDPHGRLVDVLVGGRDWSAPKLQARLMQLLPRPAPSAPTVSHRHRAPAPG